MSKGVLGDYVAVCGGDLSAGVLLQRMAFLHDKATLVKDDQRWYVSTRLEIMKACGLTERRYKDALSYLKAEDLIEVTYAASFTHGASLRTTAFRVTEKARAKLVEKVGTSKKVPTGGDVVIPTGSPDVVPTGGDTYVPTTKEISYSSSYQSNYSDEQSSTAKKATSGPVEKAFREVVVLSKPDHFHVSWNGRLKLTAKRFATAVGPEKVVEITKACIADWSAFVAFAKKSSKLSFPEEPNLISLAMHAEAAVNFTLDRKTHGVDSSKLKKLSEI